METAVQNCGDHAPEVGATGRWAIVEQMGHKTMAGLVREVILAGVPMLRVDVPEGDKPIADGAVATQYIHASSLYALTPTAEAIVRKVAARTRPEPPATWGGSARALGPAEEEELLDPVDEEADDGKVVDELLLEHGLDGVLDLLIQNYTPTDNEPDPDPDAPRYLAILEQSKRLVDQDGAWPYEAAAAVAAGQTATSDVDQARAPVEEPSAELVGYEQGEWVPLQEPAEPAASDPDDLQF